VGDSDKHDKARSRQLADDGAVDTDGGPAGTLDNSSHGS
jgi:hypothetical protein